MSFCVTPPAEEGSQPRLGERKVVSLGTQPVSLTRFWSKGAPHVFACSDRPAVVHSANQKLLYSNVNVKEVTPHGALLHLCTYTCTTCTTCTTGWCGWSSLSVVICFSGRAIFTLAIAVGRCGKMMKICLGPEIHRVLRTVRI